MGYPVTEKVESLLNRIIRDSGALDHARALEGRVIAVEIKGIDLGGTLPFERAKFICLQSPTARRMSSFPALLSLW